MRGDKAPQTVAAANGIATDRTFGAVAPPLYLSSTFAFEGFGQTRSYDYTRTGNPSRDMLADTLARLEGGIEDARRFVTALKVFTLAESLGGIESLVAHPTTMTHASMSPDARRVAGIRDTLLRLSIGLEAEADLLNDLAHAFDALGVTQGCTT